MARQGDLADRADPVEHSRADRHRLIDVQHGDEGELGQAGENRSRLERGGGPVDVGDEVPSRAIAGGPAGGARGAGAGGGWGGWGGGGRWGGGGGCAAGGGMGSGGGVARVEVDGPAAGERAFLLVLTHGAGGGPDSPDLLAVADAA